MQGLVRLAPTMHANFCYYRMICRWDCHRMAITKTLAIQYIYESEHGLLLLPKERERIVWCCTHMHACLFPTLLKNPLTNIFFTLTPYSTNVLHVKDARQPPCFVWMLTANQLKDSFFTCKNYNHAVHSTKHFAT